MRTDGILNRTRNLFQSLRIPASGLSAQRARMDVIAQNIANAETTRTANGTPYRRQTVALQEARHDPGSSIGPNMGARIENRIQYKVLGVDDEAVDPTQGLMGVEVVGIEEDATDFVPVYDPGHPDADEDGYVLFPNVNMTEEIVDLMQTRRVYEANLSVFQAVKSILRESTQI